MSYLDSQRNEAASESREAWLTVLATDFLPYFEDRGLHFNKPFRVSCGFPGGGTSARKAVGQCWGNQHSADGTNEVFISPTLSDRWEVAGTLAHELVHAAVGCEAGHRGTFTRGIRAIGLEGKPTHAGDGEGFRKWATPLVEALPSYPHATLSLGGRKKQNTRLIKVECPACVETDEPYIVRLSRKTLDLGAPLCGACQCPMEETV